MISEQERIHTPVLLNEVLNYLKPEPDKNYIDATADGGGHAIAIIKAIQPGGRLLALEWDEELLEILRQRLKKECSLFSKNYVLRKGSYTRLEEIARSFSFGPAAGVLFDFGLSSFHLGASRRGFSFQEDEPLDMRMSRDLTENAADVLARRSQRELEAILKNFGEERFAPSISRHIVAARRLRPIRRTQELVEIVHQAIPAYARRGRINFATRTFQALRIAVNHELENHSKGLEAASRILAPGGRIVAISYHSLEDRIVKNFFRDPERKTAFCAVTPKPVRPSPREILENPRSRSARLRAYEKYEPPIL